ncbi:CsgG/HfaB family protein [Stieleria varia]|uniref:Curli production assembly/transport component CsgG n=1 Tax=Stieleria varia TaxID=2528005 RepID=A0A5C5ZYW1_9BACT|nr:CsgG/HfaB family protein [Stieleria varia]TWT92792.1 Curli production assembly/transport component CsgG [Stieleria varia]
MLIRCLVILVLACSCVWARGETTSLALTTTLSDSETSSRQTLATSFVDLLEMQVGQIDSFQVIQRQQLTLVLQEQLLATAFADTQKDMIKLEKLLSADWIVDAQLLAGQGTPEKTQMLIRVVESKTGVVRGVTMALIDAASLEESAEQVTRYLGTLHESPQDANVTVAVGAFESEARFVRLRPLELGVRDMLTNELLHHSRFHVLQRSDMGDLVREMELIHAGYVDASSLPKTMPRRSAAYFVGGTIDERNSGGLLEIHVSGQVTQAGQSEPLYEFQFQSEPIELAGELSKVALVVAGVLAKEAQLPQQEHVERAPADSATPKTDGETQSLLQLVLRDLYRFRIQSPITGGEHSFRIPGIDLREKNADETTPKFESRGYWASAVKPNSILGSHLLRKSIDRLETILYIDPDNIVAAYCLAFCFRHQIDGVFNPQRATELLREIAHRHPDSEWTPLSLHLLCGVGRDHRFGTNRLLSPELSRLSTENVIFAFEKMPPKNRDLQWVHILQLLRFPYLQPADAQSLMPVMQMAARRIDETDNDMVQKGLATQCSRIAQMLGTTEAEELIRSWIGGEHKWKHHAACRSLATKANKEHDHDAAALWYQRAADPLRESEEYAERYAYENLLIHSATHWRLAGQVERAIRTLDSFSPSVPKSLNHGYYEIERGHCLLDSGQKRQAVETWVSAAESIPYLINRASLSQAITQAGGVPLREDREVDVRYLTAADGYPRTCTALTTDGSTIYCAGYEKTNHRVFAFHIPTQTWRILKLETDRVTCMQYQDGSLWVGTDQDGLWRCDIAANQWHHWGVGEGLPDSHVESLAVSAGDCYVGVGTLRGGGLIKIDTSGSMQIFEGLHAPSQAPTHIIINDDRILARTPKSISRYDRHKKAWSPLQISTPKSPLIFVGTSGLWASTSQRELYPLNQDDIAEDHFKDAWYPSGGLKVGYVVKFVIERQDEIWFGGTPYESFLCSGVYRVDKRTGNFTMFGPRDGFRMDRYYSTDGGVWAADRLWLATHAGLVELKPKPPRETEQPSDEQ